MRRAIALSEQGYPAPNPHVGCVIVLDGKVVGEGHHERAGAPHAEAVALTRAGRRAQGAEVYVTLEPCAHHGRTPPCADALVEARVRRVFVASEDPNPTAAGGVQRLREAGIEVQTGVLTADAEEANTVFLTAVRRRRVYVTLKAAITTDGYMAKPDGSSKWITTEKARERARLLRAEMGAVLVGWKTVVADDPSLTVRSKKVVNEPVRVIVDPGGRLTGEERAFGQEGRTVWLVSQGVKRHDRQTEADLHPCSLVSTLYEMGLVGVLVEGGPTTISRFAEAGVADRLELFTGTKTFGEGLPLRLPEGLELVPVQSRLVGGNVWSTFSPVPPGKKV